MSNCDCQGNIEKPIKHGYVIADTTAEEPDGLIITTVAAMTAGMFFRLRVMGLGQHDTLITSTSLVWLMSLLVWKV